MRVLLIHQAFASPDEPGGTRHFELAKACANKGIQFNIVGSRVSYLTGQSYGNKKLLHEEEIVEGVNISRAYALGAHHRSFIWRIFSFIIFMFSSVWSALRVGHVNLVIATSPPIFQSLSAWFIALIRNRPLLLEVRDLWPEFAIDMGVLKSPLLIRLSRYLESFLYSKATHILVNSPAYRDYLIDKGITEAKISFISNGVDPRMFNPEARGENIRKKLGLNDCFVMTYAGALGLANDIPSILNSAYHLKAQNNIHFLLVGDGKERSKLEVMKEELKLNNITFFGAISKNMIPEILSESDACIATLQNIPMFRTTYPNKVFDYMAAGRPTILAIDGVIREVIETCKGGVYVTPGDDMEIAKAIRFLSQNQDEAQEMGKRARAYVEKYFNRQQQSDAFIKLIKQISS